MPVTDIPVMPARNINIYNSRICARCATLVDALVYVDRYRYKSPGRSGLSERQHDAVKVHKVRLHGRSARTHRKVHARQRWTEGRKEDVIRFDGGPHAASGIGRRIYVDCILSPGFSRAGNNSWEVSCEKWSECLTHQEHFVYNIQVSRNIRNESITRSEPIIHANKWFCIIWYTWFKAYAADNWCSAAMLSE